jgi:starch phosphorylase
MAQRRLNNDYADRDKWLKMAVTNTAMSGVFSSDRTIREYNEKIWHLEPVSNASAKKTDPAGPKKPVRMKSGK